MAKKEIVLSSRIKALNKTDLSPMIKMSGIMAPRLLKGFLPKLDEKQRKAIDEILPAEGKKKFYIHLTGTPTPPIVIHLSQQLKMSVMSVDKVKEKDIKGIVLSPEELQLALDKRFWKLFWRVKGQIGSIFGLAGNFMPVIKLGPKSIKDMQNKAMDHFKPVMDMLPGSKKY